MPARSRMRECAPSAATSKPVRRLDRCSATSISASAHAIPACVRHSWRNRLTATGRSTTPSSCALVHQRREQRPVLDHVGERLARLDVAVEGEEDRPHRVARAGCRSPPCRGSAAPRSGPTRRCVSNSRRAAATMADARASVAGAPERGIGDRDREGRPEALAQRDRQRKAGKAGAADQHVDTVLRHGRRRPGLHDHRSGRDYTIVMSGIRGR